MATLKASANRTLRDAYHNILDDLDDDKELKFALMQQACARQFRRASDHERRPDTPRSDRATPRTLPAKPDIKHLRQGAHGPEPYTGADWDDPASVNALYVASTKFWPRDADADSDADDYAAGAASASDDSD
jgi:hypothetical protein